MNLHPHFLRRYEIVEKRLAGDREASQKFVISELEPGEASQLTVILQKPESLPNSEHTIRDYIERIRAEKFRYQTPDEDLLLEIKRLKEDKNTERNDH